MSDAAELDRGVDAATVTPDEAVAVASDEAAAETPIHEPAHLEGAASFDFRPALRVPPDRMRVLEAMHGVFADSLAAWLTARLHEPLRVGVRTIEQRLFREVVGGLPEDCVVYLYDVDGSPGTGALIELGPEFAYFCIDRLLGGGGDPLVPERALTQLEQRLVAFVAERVVTDVARIWSDHVPLELTPAGFESIPALIRIGKGDDVFLVAELVVSDASWQGHLRLFLPVTALESFFAVADEGRSRTDEMDEKTREDRENIQATLLAAAVDVAVRLPAFQLPLRQLANLTPGTVLPTRVAVDAPLQISISGQQRFLGRAGRSGQKLAVRILEAVRPEPNKRDWTSTEKGRRK